MGKPANVLKMIEVIGRLCEATSHPTPMRKRKAPRVVEQAATALGFEPVTCPSSDTRVHCDNCGGTGRLWNSTGVLLADNAVLRLYARYAERLDAWRGSK
jgi:hypothetical protein